MSADIFAGTAAYYARYRTGYPPDLARVLIDRFGLDGHGTLLDLGAGTGQLALALRDCFERVVAVDVNADMVEAGRRTAAGRGVDGIEWHVAPAEELEHLDDAPYRLVTIGSAFHWMDRPRVLRQCLPRTEPGGGIALVGLPGFLNIDDTTADEPWVQQVATIVKRHLGERRRAGSGYYAPPERCWQDELSDAGYTDVEAGEVPFHVTWDIDHVVGLLYSTSFANRAILGDRADAFEADLRAALATLAPDGRYHRRLVADWVIGRRR